jgi:hypothetical protein
MLILSTYALLVYAVLWVGAWWVARQPASPRTLAAVIWAPIGLLAASTVSALSCWASQRAPIVDTRSDCHRKGQSDSIDSTKRSRLYVRPVS